jgi:prepilin peptidase CpaA
MSVEIISLVFIYMFLPGMFILAGVYDVLTTRIPDWITLSLLVVFCLFAWAQGLTFTMFALHWGVAVIVFMLGFLAFSMGWMGGGDGKLAAVGALWFGPQLAPSFIVLSFIFGGFMVLAVIVLRSITLPGIVERQAWLMQWVRGKEGLPFGLAMAGAVLTLIQVEF